LIHFPLYGSGFFLALTLAANSQTNCLSIQDICKTFFAFSSNSAFNPAGTGISTLCEKPILKTNFCPCASNL
jgi:hypothetical protein